MQNNPPARLSRQFLVIAVAIGLIAGIAFLPSLGHEFLRYDDEIYVYENSHLRSPGWDAIVWMFSHSYFSSYIPLTLLSHAIDFAIWGPDPAGHHLTNVLLHAVNSALLFLLLVRLLAFVDSGTKKFSGNAVLMGAAFGALVFSLHPLRVESVAWVSDRKDLLMGFLSLLSTLSYLSYVRDTSGSKAKLWYWLSVVFLAAAILSKTVAVVFPIAFMLIDLLKVLFQELRSHLWNIVRNKIPMLVLSVLGGLAQSAAAGSPKTALVAKNMEIADWLLFPFTTLFFYVRQLVWPVDLSPIYLLPSTAESALYAAIAMAFTVMFAVLAGRTRFPLVCWLIYAVLLLPTLTGIRAGIQPWADRYSYVPSIGIALLLAGIVAFLWNTFIRARVVVVTVCLALLGGCMVLTQSLLPHWRSSLALWQYAGRVTPPTPVVLMPLGVAYYHIDSVDAAIGAFKKAIVLEPNFDDVYYNLGLAYTKKGEIDSAKLCYATALRLDSLNTASRVNLANLLDQEGQLEAAQREYETVIRLSDQVEERAGSAAAKAYYNLGILAERNRDYGRAVAMYRASIQLERGYLDPYVNLGIVFLNAGQIQQSLENLEAGVRMYPENMKANYNYALALEAAARFREAEAAYRRSIASDPNYSDAYINLGNLYARQGRLDEAVRSYENAIAVAPNEPGGYVNLGVVCYGSGKKDRARTLFSSALHLDPDLPVAHYHLGLLHAESGDTVAARTAFKKAIALGHVEAQEAEQRLTRK